MKRRFGARRPWDLTSDQNGQVIVLVALMMLVLLSFLGVAVDVGMIAVRSRQVQNAADATALAAIGAVGDGQSLDGATSTADLVLQENGFNTSDLTLTYLDGNGDQTSDLDSVTQARAVVTDTFPTTLMKLFGFQTSTASASSTANLTAILACALCIVSPDGSPALSADGDGNVTVTGGAVVVDSGADNAAAVDGDATVSAPKIGVVGGTSTTGSASFNPAPVHAASVPDPLASVPVPSPGGESYYGSIIVLNTNATAVPGIYDTLSVTGNGKITLEPGVYFITGSLSLTGDGTITGDGVTLYFTCGLTSPAACQPNQQGGSVQITGNGTLSLTPPTSGPYQGMTIFFDRNNASTIALQGNGVGVTGTIYAKSGALELGGNGSVQLNSLIVANSVNTSGNGNIAIHYQSSQNYQRAGMPGLVQ